VHYFEDGNLQLVTSKRGDTVALTSASSSPAQIVTKVIDHIKQFEISIQSGLEEMYNAMNNETFKSMRRVMPITRTKMEWNINAVRMVRQVRK
jgi:capping protein alpha